MIETLRSLALAAGHADIVAPTKRMDVSAYQGAAITRRTRSWSPGNAGPNLLLAENGEQLRRRARATVRNNAWAANGIESWCGNCVGTGIVPQPQHPNLTTRDQIRSDFERWTDESDAAGISDLYGQQYLIAREVFEAGECLVRLRPRLPKDGLTVMLQLQILECEHLPFNLNSTLENGNIIRNGIEFNGIGKRVAYHLYRSHPGELAEGMNSGEISRVPAEFVLHIYNPIRAGQHRGQTMLTQVMVRLEELDKYEDAELLRKQMAAMITHIIKQVNPEDPINMGQADTPDDDGTPIEQIQPGSTVKLLPGEEIEVSKFADVGAMFVEFIKQNLYAIAAGMGITYEMLTGDLKGVSYSSIRAGLLEFRRRCERFQHQVMVFQFLRPMWKAYMDAAALSGTINAREYATHPEWYLNVIWQPPKWPWVDPLKDCEAEALAVRNNFRSQTDVINSLGEDPERVRRQIAADNAANDALGLPPDSDARKSLKAPSDSAAVGNAKATAPPKFPSDQAAAIH